MSKRGTTRLTGPEKNLVNTPPEPVMALVRHLPMDAVLSEPCAGAGILCDHLENAGFSVAERFDIAPRRADVEAADATARVPLHVSVSNPPFEQKLLMPIMQAAVRWPNPSWWLLPWDTLANLYFAPISAHVQNLLPLGRVPWVRNPDGSPTGAGFENFGWINIAKQERRFLLPRGSRSQASRHQPKSFGANRPRDTHPVRKNSPGAE